MKPSKNPWVLNKTKTTFDRECPLSEIPYIIREDGTRGCIWCGDDLKTKHHAQRYCRDKDCPKSAYIWGYPQREESLVYLLNKQDGKCGLCGHDYKQYVKDSLTVESFRQIKFYINLFNRPEVDHIIPISKGGQSLGIENHQVICYTCHKNKTKEDVKGERREKSPLEKQKLQDKKTEKVIHEKLSLFLKEHYTDRDWDNNFKKYREIFLMKILTIEEIKCQIRRREKYPEDLGEFKEMTWLKEALEKRTQSEES